MSNEKFKPIKCSMCGEEDISFDDLRCGLTICKTCRSGFARSTPDDFKKAILKTEYSERFDEIRKNLVIQSYYKYGEARKNFGGEYVNAIGCIEKCLRKFEETGNTEYLADVANYAMFRFMYPKSGEYFKYSGSEDSAGIDGMSVKEIERFKEENEYY